MGSDIVSTPLVLDSLQDRLREAELNETVPLRDAYRQWKARSAERQGSSALVLAEHEPLTVSIGKVVAVAAAVAAAAAVYKSLSRQSPPPEVMEQVRESLRQNSSIPNHPEAIVG